jgi:hypothetical protein
MPALPLPRRAVALRPSRRGQALLRSSRRLPAQLSARFADDAGGDATTVRTLTLKL